MLGDVVGFFSGLVFGFWDMLTWLVRTWCELIVSLLSILGWLLVIASVLVLLSGDMTMGAAIYVAAFAFLACSQLFRLLDFWLSEKRYTVAPEAFVGDVLGTVFGFIVIFGLLFAVWYFVYPADLLLVSIAALAPISILNSLSRFTKNFLATLKDKLKPRPGEEKKQGGAPPSLMSSVAANVAPKIAEAAKQAMQK
jgi:hypothetical protein